MDGTLHRAEGESAPDGGARLFAAWAAVLLASDLPEILLSAGGGGAPGWLAWGKVGVAGLFALVCLGARRPRPLAPFAAVLFVLLLALRGSAALAASALWRGATAGWGGSFTLAWLEPLLRDLGVALAVLAALWLVFRDRERFLFRWGDLGAPIEPVPWLGIRKPEPWRPFPWIFGGVAALIVVAVTIPSLRPTGAELAPAAWRLPSVGLLAALNAFDEEVYFRLALLTTLPAVVGRRPAMAMQVVLFGLAHYLHGAPSGLLGFAMTGFLAYLMGKAVLETRGLGAAWIIHFLADLPIFATYAVLWERG